ncbi:MAG: hypothetical protein HY815_07730 [Candidatus Riflebacteria bacterium]|nr:hypothetical protein [Candidatus Riflebacteria bacterium]
MLREGESTSLLQLLPYSLLACVLAYVAFERLVLVYGQEVAAREELVIQSRGRGQPEFRSSRMGQIRQKHTVTMEEKRKYDQMIGEVKRFVEKLPSAQDPGRMVWVLHRLAGDSRCTITSVRVEPVPMDKRIPDLVRTRATVNLKGTYPDLRSFLWKLQTDPEASRPTPIPILELSIGRFDDKGLVAGDVQIELLGRKP